MTTTTFYLITAYTPTFGSQALHLNQQQSLLVALCIGISNFPLVADRWLDFGSNRSGYTTVQWFRF
jgi:hypothetical protein